ncbi:hypothetical protein AC578_9362 [Pseudocercospora eumusae]|uniref:Major facilitator superfamily (MFS) profile domain-containing protein n=1 Tax=Pseudocercospora eumusae TaxID=321146 RepID=A0A139GU15_9PEZI|nr:hypothetical protein AC578_9362 [Pseudocercospora eumusae]
MLRASVSEVIHCHINHGGAAPSGALNLNIDLKEHRWAIFYHLVATIGALCYGLQTIHCTGIQSMRYFARDHGEQQADGTYELGTTFLSVSASIIYAGEFCGALIAAPINDKFGRKAVFTCAAICIILGAIIQVCAYSIAGVFYIGRVFVGFGVGQFTASCLMYVADVAPSAIRAIPWTSHDDVPIHAVDRTIRWSSCETRH